MKKYFGSDIDFSLIPDTPDEVKEEIKKEDEIDQNEDYDDDFY